MNHLHLRIIMEEREHELRRSLVWVAVARDNPDASTRTHAEIDLWEAEIREELENIKLLRLDIARRN
jgi:hypothetical protein